MPESTIQVAVPSYPAEFGNEAYRIAESMEASAVADTVPDTADQGGAAADYYSAGGMQQPAQPQQHAYRCSTLAWAMPVMFFCTGSCVERARLLLHTHGGPCWSPCW